MAKHRPDRSKGPKSNAARPRQGRGPGPRPGPGPGPRPGRTSGPAGKPGRPARIDGKTISQPEASNRGKSKSGERAASGGGGSSAGPKLERLQKVLARAGLGSRRGCEELVLKGRVIVNGEVVRQLGTRVDPETARITVDGEAIRREAMVYFAVNKPPGYVSTNFDPAGRPRVVDLLPEVPERVYTVGRLDEDSTGLMILTNDGELAHGLAHPRFGVEKLYRALVAGAPEPETIARLTEGVWLSDGKVRAKRARVVGRRGQATTIELVLAEGKKREVRRMLSKLGHKVMSLTRLAVGPITLKGLSSGACRPLARREVELLRLAASGKPVPSPSNTFGNRRASTGPSTTGPRERRESTGTGPRPGVSDHRAARPRVTSTSGDRRTARPGQQQAQGQGQAQREDRARGPKLRVTGGPAAPHTKPSVGAARPKPRPKPGAGSHSKTARGAGPQRKRPDAAPIPEAPALPAVSPAPARPTAENAPRGRRIIGLKLVGRPGDGAGRPSARRTGPKGHNLKRPTGRKSSPPHQKPKRSGPATGAPRRERNDDNA